MATTFTPNFGFDLPALGDTSWGGMRNTNMSDLDAELFKPRIGQSALTWGATTTVDLSLARVFTATVNANSTIAFSNVPSTFPNGAVVPVVWCDLILTNGGAFAITWPGSVTWLAGSAPALKASGVDIVRLVTRDGGTTWYGMALDRPLSRTVGSVTADAGTGAATTETTLHTVAVPANTLGLNGALRIRVHYSVSGSAAAKQIAIYYGGSQIGLSAQAAGETLSHGMMETVMVNRNATNAQHFSFITSDTITAVNFGGGTIAVDSTVAQNILVRGTTPDAADEVTAHVTLVELLRS